MKIDTNVAAIPPKFRDTDNISTGREKQSFDIVNSDSRVDELVLSNKYTNLTGEQINYLKEKYDVEHIDDGQLWNLLGELADMGAMDGKNKLFAFEANPISYLDSENRFSVGARTSSERENRHPERDNLLNRMNSKLEEAKVNLYSSQEDIDLISHFINILNLIKR